MFLYNNLTKYIFYVKQKYNILYGGVNMKKAFLVFIIVSMMAPAAFAGAVRNNVGCGIGTLLFESVGKPNGGWLLQITAAWTNNALSNTFSMTTGTINCEGNINKAVSVEVYEFVTANMDNLAKDIAMGHGDTINSLGSMLAVKDVNAFGSKLQANFSEIFPNSEVQSDSVANKIIALS